MTREEEINNAFEKALPATESYTPFFGEKVAFRLGANWADANPKSPWISVKDDLPCLHEKLISHCDKTHTQYVIAIIHGYIILSRMYKLEGKWHWEKDEPDYWFPIPKLPKEYFKIQRKSL